MPFEARGTKIVKKTTGKVVGTSKSEAAAKRAARIRNAVAYSTESAKKRGPRRSIGY